MLFLCSLFTASMFGIVVSVFVFSEVFGISKFRVNILDVTVTTRS
jgi:hypothetical protein